ncbi:hypothetical protein AX14_013467 [Amanita brunnescens Koide BX004]|nr:hypothetical protein AX14_013467 [Amanita brunnescens Koide BX004]
MRCQKSSTTMSTPRIAIIIYSMYGHITKTPPKPDYPVMMMENLPDFDGYLLVIPTRLGSMPGQWKAFWDTTGALWASGALAETFAGVFVSTSVLGGGQDMTVANTMSTLVHHGINFVPLSYKHAPELTNIDEVRGGSPWGAGTLRTPTGTRDPSALELKIARMQGKAF